MRKLKGTITETMVVMKEFDFEVPDDDERDDDEAVKDHVYENSIWNEHNQDWEGLDCLEVDIEYIKEV